MTEILNFNDLPANKKKVVKKMMKEEISACIENDDDLPEYCESIEEYYSDLLGSIGFDAIFE